MIKQEEARQIVSQGLELRKIRKEAEQKEAQLEQYEQDMISHCNLHCVNARKDRQYMEQDSAMKEAAAARRAERAAAKAKAWQLECKSNEALRKYGVLCLVVLLLAAITKLPGWAAMALIAGGAVFPAAYIYRLYVPFGGEQNAQRAKS